MNVIDLSPELKAALSEVKNQYLTRGIKRIEDIGFGQNVLWFIPESEADESWVGGHIVIKYKANVDSSETLEIIDFDADTGRVYADAPKSDFTKSLSADLDGFYFSYRPFDFSAALTDAFENLRRHLALLKSALERSCGLFDPHDEGLVPMMAPVSVPDGMPEPPEGVRRLWQLPWSMVWGPPGTGKTEAVARISAAYAAVGSGNKILIATPTNISADEVAYRICSLLAEQGHVSEEGDCYVYRGGRGAGEKLSERFPECLRDKVYARLYDETKKKIASLKDARVKARRSGDYVDATRLSKEIAECEGRLPDETDFAIYRGKAKVIILTTFKACMFVGRGENPVLFDKVIIDEAGMVSRAACAALASMGKTVLLAGDPKQIGPIFCSPKGASRHVRKWIMSSG